MQSVVLISTGGTIASRADADGAQVAVVGGNEILDGIDLPTGVSVSVRTALTVNSYAMTLVDLEAVSAAVDEALADPDIAGVVVTHGTDTTEETAFLVELSHSDDRPVVFTGAQRSADTAGSDGGRNLRDAVVLAASPTARGLGVLIVFDGSVNAACGTRKVETQASAAFADPDAGPLGHIVAGDVKLHRPIARKILLDRRPTGLAENRVDIVCLYPGADRVAIDAFVSHGAAGIVLEGTGLGNANTDVVQAVRDHVANGIVVLVSTRVHRGPVHPVYGGGGGGRDLEAAGAIFTGLLRPSQARIQLAALLANGTGIAQLRASF